MRPLGLIALALTSLVLGACGDSSQKGPPGSPDNPLRALPNPAPTRIPPTGEAAAPRNGSSHSEPRAPTSLVEGQKRAQARNERRRAEASAKSQTTAGAGVRPPRQAPRAGARRPCSLVSKATATSIMGTPLVEPIHGRQGPTCIYRSLDGRRHVTLTVQSASYSRLAAQLRGRRTLTVAQRRGVCGTIGDHVLYVRLTSRRVLTIAAPCAVATRFAARALASL